MTGIEKIPITNADMRIDTARNAFDMREIQNRRFMFNPQTGTLIFGRQYSGNQIVSSHAEEHGRVGAAEPFDDFVRGWTGTGRSYANGVIHFSPPIPKDSPELFDKGYSTLELFAQNGADGDTVIRGFPGAWEQPLSGIIDSERLNDLRKEVIKNMAENFYSVADYGDRLQPADRLKIEHHVYFREEKADMSHLTALPVERLQAMREDSAAAEQVIFEKIREATNEWDVQAAQTLMLDKAIEFVRTPPVKHTANQWEENEYSRSMSNMVYKIDYRITENTRYSQDAQKSIPYSWDLTWSVRTNTPGNHSTDRIAGQSKTYADKAELEKYLAGRIKAHSHLFTEISPPIPQEYANNFRVNGQLLPGYTIEGEEPKQPEHAAGLTVGGDSISGKEREDMHEPLNIQLTTRELYEAGSGGAWLKLPATAEQLNAALARIGAREGENSFFINGFESPVAAVARLPLENVQRAGIDELNFLAVRLEMFEQAHVDKLNAAAEIMTDSDDVHRLTEYTFCPDFYDFHPDIANHIQLGEHTLEYSGLIQIPEEWTAAIDIEKLGQLAAEHEKGRFTEYGYIVPSGGEWYTIDRDDIPQEYRIALKIEEPDREADATATRTATQTATRPPQEQAAPAEKTAPAAAAAAPFVLVAENPRDRMKEITDKLETGIKGIFDSEQYKSYLKTLSKFHNYSFNNCLLIAMQKPDATHVAGFNAWKDDFKRQVRKGEKGIKILAPAPFKTKKMVDAVDANGKPKYDKNGRRVKEEKEITVPAFKVTSVFDVSQTDGEPLPQLGVNELMGSVDRYREFFAALEKTSPVPVGFEAISSGAKGYYQQIDKRIAINEGMSELQNLKTLIHEIAHARLHDIDKNAPKNIPRPDQKTREVEAESIAYTVCQHYGLDTSDYSFGYIATWSGDKQLDTLKASLDTIRKEADAIITEVDKQLAELTQDRAQTAERPAAEQGDTFTIYQLKDGDGTRDFRFMPFDALKEAPDMANYDKTYTAALDSSATLEKIFFTFNMDRPEDFKGHSLSVSDVVVMNRDGKETAFYVDGGGFKELPGFLPQKEPTRETPAQTVNLTAVADYMQKLYDGLQAVKPDSSMSVGAYNATVKRLEQSNGRIPDTQPQLKALLAHAAQSPDFNELKNRMETLKTEFIQHYSTAVQMTIDTGGKAEPPAPAASTRQNEPKPAQKSPAYGENVAAIEAQVKAGQTINLSDLSDAIKKDKQAAQSAQAQQPGKTAAGKTAQQGRAASRGKGAVTPNPQEKPSIREELAAGKKQLASQKSAPSRTAAKGKAAEIGG